jgi:hypothetical protein
MAPVAAGGAVLLHRFYVEVTIPLWMLSPFGILVALLAMRSQLDGTYQLESGDEAQSWTEADLKRLIPHGWYVIPNIPFDGNPNVDLVLFGPAGVCAIEVKYTDSLSIKWARGQEWVGQALDTATRLRWLLGGNYGHHLDVRHLVVVSGHKGVRLPREPHILRRRDLARFVDQLKAAPPSLSPEQIESIRAALLEYRGGALEKQAAGSSH